MTGAELFACRHDKETSHRSKLMLVADGIKAAAAAAAAAATTDTVRREGGGQIE